MKPTNWRETFENDEKLYFDPHGDAILKRGNLVYKDRVIDFISHTIEQVLEDVVENVPQVQISGESKGLKEDLKWLHYTNGQYDYQQELFKRVQALRTKYLG